MPAISIIVPVYKVEKYIHRCVDSILGQTYADFELILVDDGSPDNCGAICEEYAAKDSRVVVIHQENGGLSAARNAGIDWAFANSDSQWLTFIDSDDWVHPEYLRCLLDAAVGHNVAVSICGFVQTDGSELEIVTESLEPIIWDTEEFYVTHNVNATVAWGKLYRKECFREIRYPVGKIHEDGFVTHRILFENSYAVFIPAGLYSYFRNAEGIMHSPFALNRYDGVAAREERIVFFTKYGYHMLAQIEKSSLEYEIALFAIAARKQKIYKMIPTKYRMGWLRAMIIVRKTLTKDQYEWVMNPYHPCLVRFFAVCCRIKGILCAKKDKQ